MKRLALVLFLFPIAMSAQFQTAKFPVAEKKDHIRTIHGESVQDPYYWMYDYFGKGPDSTKVVDYLKAENNYLDSVMLKTQKLQADLFTEMKSRIKEKDETLPSFKNGYFYYTKTEKGKEYYKYCRKKGSLDAPEEILLDIDEMAKGHSYFEAGGFEISKDNKLLAFAVDKISRRQYTLYVKNLETGKILKDSVLNAEKKITWANDNKTFFYISKNPVTLLGEKIFRHSINTETKNDKEIYHEKDLSNSLAIEKTKNDKYILIYSVSKVSSEIQMIKAENPNDPFTVFQPRIKDVTYYPIALDDKFLIKTNKDGATNFKLMECPLDKTEAKYWKEIIPNRDDVLLQTIEEFKNFIVINERKNGLAAIRIKQLNKNSEHYINFGESCYSVSFDSNPEYNTSTFRFKYTSFTTPNSTFDYNMVSKEKKLLKQDAVEGDYNANDYATERLYATAKDGTKIPISLVYKKGFKKNGEAPLLLLGYGSYGTSLETRFNSTRLSLLDRGFVFAIAHVRGGQEMGRQWYQDGKLMKKKNTFTDFIDCAEFLIQNKYTSSKHLYANGGSAGGLLMGVVSNLAPDLFNGIVAEVPFVDVINTMLDESIPLTTLEFDEWGDPKNKEAYLYMKSYSPYENVERKNYPNMLVTTGLHDSQVQYFEPSKWVAKLRDLKTDNNLLLFHTNMNFGHGGASGRFDYLNDLALKFAFLINLENNSK